MADKLYSDENPRDERSKLMFSNVSFDSAAAKPWYMRTEFVTGIVLSVIWALFAVDFLGTSGWWESRYEMTPPEFAGFLSGMMMPPVLVWFVVFYFVGHKRYDDEAVRLRAYMRSVLQPTPKEKLYVKSLLQQLSVETGEMNDVYQNIARGAETVADKLAGTLEQMHLLVHDLDSSLTEGMAGMDDKIRMFSDESASAAREIQDSLKVLDGSVLSLNAAAAAAKTDVGAIDGIVKQAQNTLTETQDVLQSKTRALTDEVREQNRLLVHASEKAQDILSAQTALMSEKSAEQNAALTDFVEKVRQTLAEQSGLIKRDVLEQTDELVKTQERLQDNVAALGILVEEQTAKLSDASLSARADAAKINTDFDTMLDNLNAVVDEQIGRVTRVKDMLDETTGKTLETFQKQNVLLDGEAETILSRFKVVESSLDTYVREIATVSDDAFEKIGAVSSALSTKSDMLKEISAESGAALTALANSLDDKTVVLTERADALEDKAGALSAAMDGHVAQMTGVLESASATVAAGTKEMLDSAALFEDCVGKCADKTKTLIDGLTQKSSEINDLSAALVSQAMVTETSLAQQQKYLVNAAANVEEVKKSLKQQAQDLFDIADLLDGKAKKSVDVLLAQMTQTVEQANIVIDKINEADATLANETAGLNGAVVKVSAVCGDLNDRMKRHVAELNAVQTQLSDGTEALAVTAEKQAALLEHRADALCGRMHKTLDDMDARFDKMHENAGLILDDVAQTSERLASHAADMDVLYDKQGASLGTASDKLLEQASQVTALLRQQSEQVDNDLERLIGRIRLLQEGLEVQTKELSSASDTVVSRMESVGKGMNRQTEALTSAADTVKERITGVSDIFEEKTKLFSDTLKSAIVQASECAEQVGQYQAAFQNSADTLTAGVGGLTDSLTAQTDALQKQAEKSTKQAIMVRDAMQRQIVELTDVANVVTTQSRLGEASLSQQTHYLREAAEEVMAHIRNINEAVRQNTNDLLGASSRIGFELDAMGENLRQRNDEASAAAADSLERSTQAAAFLQEKAAVLAEVTQNVIAAIQSAGQTFEDRTAQMRAASEMAREQLVGTGDSFLVQSYQLNRISEDAQKAIKGLSVSLRERAGDFAKTAEEAGDRVQSLKDAVHQIGTEFEDMSNKGVIQIDLAGQRLRSMISEVASNSERIALEVRKSGEQFVNQSDVLTQATDGAAERLDSLLALMKQNASAIQETGDKISAQSIKLGGAFGRQVQALLDASKSAEEYISALEQKKAEADTGVFMQDATFIIERLQSLGVDITRVFDSNVADDLWKRYYNGDRSAFVRYLSRTLDKNQVRKMSDMFIQNSEFREYVSKYIAEFESILNKAQASERGDVLTDVLLGSDAGHLYLLLGKVFNN